MRAYGGSFKSEVELLRCVARKVRVKLSPSFLPQFVAAVALIVGRNNLRNFIKHLSQVENTEAYRRENASVSRYMHNTMSVSLRPSQPVLLTLSLSLSLFFSLSLPLCVCVCVILPLSAYMYVCVSLCVHMACLYVSVCVCVCLYVCMCVCVCMSTHSILCPIMWMSRGECLRKGQYHSNSLWTWVPRKTQSTFMKMLDKAFHAHMKRRGQADKRDIDGLC